MIPERTDHSETMPLAEHGFAAPPGRDIALTDKRRVAVHADVMEVRYA